MLILPEGNDVVQIGKKNSGTGLRFLERVQRPLHFIFMSVIQYREEQSKNGFVLSTPYPLRTMCRKDDPKRKLGSSTVDCSQSDCCKAAASKEFGRNNNGVNSPLSTHLLADVDGETGSVQQLCRQRRREVS